MPICLKAPGTGKSHLIKAVAAEADANFYTISSYDLITKFFGASEK